MARSNVKTWLPLDRWAEIIGLYPMHFNQLYSPTLNHNNVCGEIFYQYSYMHSDRIGREDIAMAIQEAEQEIAAEAGFNLMPDWTVEERLTYPQPFAPGVFNMNGLNVRGMLNSVELARGHVISGGTRLQVNLALGTAIVRTDADGDGYAETCTVTVPTTVTDVNLIAVYYPNHNGEAVWEIRPIKVTLTGANAIITFKSWQVALATAFDDFTAPVLDADDPASYETGVDVYLVGNFPGTQVQFMWENNGGCDNCCGSCTACQFGTQAGCFHLRDARLGLAVPSPATWDERLEEFTGEEWTACRAPDQIRFWYYSGFQNKSLARPLVTMDPYWEYAVAYFAASKIDHPICGCSNVQQFIDKWRMDLLINRNDDKSFNVTPEMLSNRLGSTMGALYAWKRVHQNGVRIVK